MSRKYVASEEIDVPDVTPMINVNLMILVFALLMVCNSSKLLPLFMPKAEKTEFIEMAQASMLRVEKDGYSLNGQKTGKDELAAAIAELWERSMQDCLAKYGESYDVGACSAAFEQIRAGGLSREDQINAVKVILRQLTPIHQELRKEGKAGPTLLGEQAVVAISADPAAKYDHLVFALDKIMAWPGLNVAFGEPGAAVKVSGAPAARADGAAAPAAPN